MFGLYVRLIRSDYYEKIITITFYIYSCTGDYFIACFFERLYRKDCFCRYEWSASYENVLIKSGDTLSSLADTYAEKYSNLSKAEYEEAIISLNSLPSENIHAGGYLLLPNFK